MPRQSATGLILTTTVLLRIAPVWIFNMRSTSCTGINLDVTLPREGRLVPRGGAFGIAFVSKCSPKNRHLDRNLGVGPVRTDRCKPEKSGYPRLAVPPSSPDLFSECQASPFAGRLPRPIRDRPLLISVVCERWERLKLLSMLLNNNLGLCRHSLLAPCPAQHRPDQPFHFGMALLPDGRKEQQLDSAVQVLQSCQTPSSDRV